MQFMCLNRVFANNRGSALADVLIFSFIIVFIVLPLFAAVSEGYILLNKTQIIRDAIDIASISSYSVINGKELGKKNIQITGGMLTETWRHFLALNLKLGADLEPLEGSVVDGKVEILELAAYIDGLPSVCSKETRLTRPSVHSVVSFPVAPMLFGKMILRLCGHEYLHIVVHVDSEIPVNY